MKALKVSAIKGATTSAKADLTAVGLVAENWRQLYDDLPRDPAGCREFARETGWPLLPKYRVALYRSQDVGPRFRACLERSRLLQGEVAVCFDFQGDWELVTTTMAQIPGWDEAATAAKRGGHRVGALELLDEKLRRDAAPRVAPRDSLGLRNFGALA